MRAILLAAGLGNRLRDPTAATPPLPKCLLRFGGHSLLERHLRLLRAVGIDDVVIATGYASAAIEAELDRLDGPSRPRLVQNPDYALGSVLTVHRVAAEFGDDTVLMDADVLYDQRMLQPLCAGPAANRLLLDRGFQPGEEPVKICLREGRIVEFRKRLAAALAYDVCGESVGFFRFDGRMAATFLARVAAYVAEDRADQPHEEAIRDILLDAPQAFEVADVTGLPWLEIDFPADLRRARDEVLPQLDELP